MNLLTKKYRLLYVGTEIKNADHLKEQTGKTYPGAGVSFAESDTLSDIEKIVSDLGLVAPKEAQMPYKQ